MLDTLLGRVFGTWLERVGGRFANRAAALVLGAFIASLGAVPLIALNHDWIGLVLFAVTRIVAAVAARASKEDAATSSVLDAVAFAALPFGFALGDPSRALAAVFLMFGFVALFAASLKFGRAFLAEAELVIIFLVVCLFPDRFGIVAYIAGVLCFVAAGVRVAAPRRS